jgi:hypothetical protein
MILSFRPFKIKIIELFFACPRRKFEKILKIEHNKFMSSACIFGSQHEGRSCEHAECMIIRSIKKINRPIFKKHRAESSKRRNSELSWGSEESSFPEGGEKKKSGRQEEAPKLSEKTIPSACPFEDFTRVAQLEEEVRTLRYELLYLRSRL